MTREATWLQNVFTTTQLRRCISPDSIEYLDPESINGLNVYCYCHNNPIMNVDPNGHAWYNVLWNWANTIAGFLNPISTMTAIGAIVTSAFNGNWSGLDIRKEYNIL